MNVISAMNAIRQVGILALLLGVTFARAQAPNDWSVADGHHSRTGILARSNSSASVGSIVGKIGTLRAKITSSAGPTPAVLAAAGARAQLCSLHFVRETDLLAVPIDPSQGHPARAPPFQQI
jgi:hypothetical protein